MNTIFAIIGGDARQISLAARLALTGAEVRTFGLPQERLATGILFFEDWKQAINKADVVLLPLPASADGIHINLPLSPGALAPTFLQLLDEIPDQTHLIGGKFTPAMRTLADTRGRVLFDYCRSEQFQQKNAVPTAEGAVAILMDREKRTVQGLPVAITGYGRVARALARLLVAMGAEVTVGARRDGALAEAAHAGCRTLRLCDEKSTAELAKGKAAVFNTVPHWLFVREVLATLSKDTLLIDLASAPGGVDAEAASGLGVPVVFALSLPGKYSPVTAGEIIAETVLEYLGKEGGA